MLLTLVFRRGHLVLGALGRAASSGHGGWSVAVRSGSKSESQEFSATGDLRMEIRSVSLFKGRGRLVVYGSQTSDVPRWFVQVWRDLVRHPSRAETSHTRSGHVICQDLRFTPMHLRPLPCIIQYMAGQRKLLSFVMTEYRDA
jgi:hypothetical protein